MQSTLENREFRFLKAIIVIVFLVFPVLVEASIIPRPVKMENRRGSFLLKGNLVIHVPATNPQASQHAIGLAVLLKRIQGLNVNVLPYPDHARLPATGIVLALQTATGKPQGYILDISSKRILIKGDDMAGLFYGIQSLRQLLPPEMDGSFSLPSSRPIRINSIYLKDYPAFSYRGMHLDVGRHFFDVEFIKKYLDLMAMHKMNTFHWHLTEDQGWRIEIRKYPLLTEAGAWRKETLVGHGSRSPFQYDGTSYGGFYSQDQIREVVAYAAQRHITVVPEIEMPGHATAALAAYPQLGCTGGPYEVVTRWGIFEDAFCAGSEFTFEFLENVLTEVVELFPSRLIHIGGDECLKNRWKECARCQQRIIDEGLADEHELQSYFIRRIEKFLLTKNRNIIGWDEILEGGLAPQATVMSWRGVRGGIEAAKLGHNVIMTPTSHCYFDYYQADPATQPLAIGGYLTLRQVYSFNPIPDGLTREEAKRILGGQGNVWTEYIKTPNHVEYMVFPRAIALAEVLWSPKTRQDFDDFSSRLKVHFNRLDALNVNYHNPW